MMIHSFILLTVSFFVSVSVGLNPCPPPEDIHPCTCHQKIGPSDIKCNGVKNGTQLTAALRRLKNYRLDGLSVEESTIDYLPRGLFKEVPFQSVIFFKTTFKSLTFPSSDGNSPFAGLEESMTLFGCTEGGPIDNWNWKEFARLDALRSVFLGANNWKIIPRSFSEGAKNVRIFVSTLNGLKDIEDGALAGFSKLEKLAINHHEITTLRRGMLPRPAKNLVDVSFSYGKLTSLSDDIFDEMPALKVLDLSYNSFSTLSESTFQPFWKQVAKFSFTGNPVICDCRLSWLAGERCRLIDLPLCSAPGPLRGKKLSELEPDELTC